MTKPPAQMPAGRPSSIFQGISENFTFHASPEAFISARVLSFQQQQPDIARRRVVVRAKVLNRNVAIVTSRAQIIQVLHGGDDDDGQAPRFVAAASYNQLMEAFFPPPNLLLLDGCPHTAMRDVWTPATAVWQAQGDLCHSIARDFFTSLSKGVPVNLYETLKTLSWRLILEACLAISPRHEGYDEILRLQEDLLRGQFSLFPVSINAGFWHSPRRVGIGARQKLQHIISKRLDSHRPAWLSQGMVDERRPEIINHLLMSTSSLAVKGLASVLTAVFLNYFLFTANGRPAPCQIGTGKDVTGRIHALLLETLRLSPPIVGVMRRATRDSVLTSPETEADVIIPRDWDVWLYIAGSGRDEAAYGESHATFEPERFLGPKGKSLPEPLAFGTGPKTCLGKNIMIEACTAVLTACHAIGIGMEGSIASKRGVMGWLGWGQASPEEWAQEMKQVPTAHPSQPIMVTFK